MSHDPEVIQGLEAAVAAAPDNVALRLHLAGLHLDGGNASAALEHASKVLAIEPSSQVAQRLIERAAKEMVAPSSTGDTAGQEIASTARDADGKITPMKLRVMDTDADSDLPSEVERPKVTLADVGGMDDVKRRLEMAFLAPMRNPELREMYGKSLRGGLLLWGPPGCGKTFIARATAGELQAQFIGVALADVLDMWLGLSEKNLHGVFEMARRHAPCVLFIDELDALGQKRTQLRQSAMRGVISQLLNELDGAFTDNEGVFVLGATNAPWDIDPALKRPGRFDRSLLVLPPDAAARHKILSVHLADRPVAGDIDLKAIVKMTEKYTGADLAHVCESAAEAALMSAIETGNARPIAQADLLRALREISPTTSEWFSTARNFAIFQNEGGNYDTLLDYMRRNHMG
jgi:SpoVK/Ycf46/Vps4 family AAA+-type ATPase